MNFLELASQWLAAVIQLATATSPKGRPVMPFLRLELFYGYLLHTAKLDAAVVENFKGDAFAKQRTYIAYQIDYLNATNHPRIVARIELERQIAEYRLLLKTSQRDVVDKKIMISTISKAEAVQQVAQELKAANPPPSG